jgi:hypothetical protein
MRNRLLVYVVTLLINGCMIFLSADLSFGGTVGLPKTGQTTCYDTAGNVILCVGTGEDGDIQAGVPWPAPRFTDNGNGTVTDNLTGLMWFKDGNCLGTKNWQEALDEVADLNENPANYTCGGYTATYDDWVLPNVNELESLCNAEVPNLATWLNGKGFVDVQPNDYWSSTTSAKDSLYALVVRFIYGGTVTTYGKSNNIYVWPVRAMTTPPAAVWKTGQTQSYDAGDDGTLQRGLAWPEPRFTENGDGTVTDNLTGLMWLADAKCFFGANWQEALDKVADLNASPGSYLCGGYTATYNNWRLPNRKELLSLTDFSQYDPALPEGHPFSNVQLYPYWSSTTSAKSTDEAWVLHMDNGIMINYNKSLSYFGYVWPVRAGASTIYVSQDGICGGKSPCYSSIQDAIDNATTESHILVKQGTYGESISLENPKTLVIKGGYNSAYDQQEPNATFIQGLGQTTIQGRSGTLRFQMLTIKPPQ